MQLPDFQICVSHQFKHSFDDDDLGSHENRTFVTFPRFTDSLCGRDSNLLFILLQGNRECLWICEC